ncbi:MAG: hypothetical protein PHI66_04490 [Candidatus Pacebacteria bacterium]|nr:hypothetical protein [Candidatus Paceibacterota bacterium]
MQKRKALEKGMITPVILIVTVVFFVFAISLMGWSIKERKNTLLKVKSAKALQVAEAGIDYYKWHLNHDDEDYQDGGAWCCENDPDLSLEDCSDVCGPYPHIYMDYDGNAIGEFSLIVKPSRDGSSIFEVESTGRIYEDSSVEKTVLTRLGRRSLARYSFLSNSPIWIGEDESTSGPVHSNGGIRFDGDCNAEVTSAVDEYSDDSANHDFTGTKDGIWGDANASCQQYWQFPTTGIDFTLFTLDMSNIRDNAISAGLYLADSEAEGYHIKFKSDGTFDVSKVTAVKYNVKYKDVEEGVWKIDNEGIKRETFLGNYDIPYNGLIFVEDHIWIEGIVNGRVTVAASNFSDNPNDYATITINGNLTYLSRDGNNVLGLLAEGDILVPRHAPGDLVIDAVMLSQKEHVYRRVYDASYTAQSIEVYGGVISYLFWTWTWVDGHGNTTNGYRQTSTIYDNDLMYNPPPFFPTEENFEIISWEEVD